MKQIREASSLRQAGKLILTLAMFLLLTSVVLAQSGGGYDLSWWTVDGGGGTSEGGGYTLFGIAGQPDIGPSMSGGDYTLAGGFWGVGGVAASPGGGPIYLPMILKHHAPGPDLVVESLVATSNAVTVTIKNQGNVPVTDEFWVDVYFNPSVTPSINKPWDTIASHGVVWGVTTPIMADGGTLTLTTGDAYYVSEYSSTPPLPVGADVYALVDSINYDTTYGMVLESNENNNLFGPVTSTAGVAGEAAPIGNQGQSPSMEGLPPRQ